MSRSAGGRRSRRPAFRPTADQQRLLDTIADAVATSAGWPEAAVQAAHEAGIPLRPIAAAAGVSHETVRRWLA